MSITLQKGRAIVSALFLAVALSVAGVFSSALPTAHADNWTRLQNYAWQGGNFACYTVQTMGPYWGAAPFANWSMWRINDGVFTREELYIVLALGAAQKCPEHFWIFAAFVPPEIAQRIAPPPPPVAPSLDTIE